MKRKLSTYNIILIVVIVLSLGLIFVENASAITGHSITQDTFSNVTISAYYAVDWSTNLTTGIIFEPIYTLPVSDDNATGNWVNPPTDNSSDYWANVSDDGNLEVNFCLRANGAMQNGVGDSIGLGNESYAGNVTSSNFTSPSVDDEISFTTSYVEATSNIYPGNVTYWRFWLDVPVGQAVGDYSNTVQFKAIADPEVC